MAEGKGILGIEVEYLEQIIRSIVRKEMKELKEEVKQLLSPLLKQEKLYTQEVAELLKVDRKTIRNYIKSGKIPEPQRTATDRPYWTADQIEQIMTPDTVKNRFKFPV